MEKTKDGVIIDPRLLLPRIWRIMPWLLVAAIICGAAAWCITTFAITPLYSSSATVYVYSDGTNNRNETMYVTYSELYAAQYLADPYVSVLQSDSVLQKVVDRLDLDISASQIRKRLKITGGDRSLILTVTFSDPDPELAQKVVKTITAVAPGEIKRVIKAGGISVIDEARLPSQPTSPDIMLNTAIGAVGGALALLIILVISDFLNPAIRSEEDIEEALSVPVLGTIPRIDNSGKDERA